MLLLSHLIVAVSIVATSAIAASVADVSTDGVAALVQRRLPQHADAFEFTLVNISTSTTRENDSYTVTSTVGGKIVVEGNTVSALLSGYVI